MYSVGKQHNWYLQASTPNLLFFNKWGSNKLHSKSFYCQRFLPITRFVWWYTKPTSVTVQQLCFPLASPGTTCIQAGLQPYKQ